MNEQIKIQKAFSGVSQKNINKVALEYGRKHWKKWPVKLLLNAMESWNVPVKAAQKHYLEFANNKELPLLSALARRNLRATAYLISSLPQQTASPPPRLPEQPSDFDLQFATLFHICLLEGLEKTITNTAASALWRLVRKQVDDNELAEDAFWSAVSTEAKMEEKTNGRKRKKGNKKGKEGNKVSARHSR